MSLKDLFKNRESFKFSSLKSADDVAREVEESSEFIEQYQKDKDRLIPPVDYSDPANFARYGLAEKYYEDTIKRIYQTYPYDGSLREVLEWHNSSSFIDEHIFENGYPRTNGYINFSGDGYNSAKSIDGTTGYGTTHDIEYIHIKGGPHSGSSMAIVKTGFTGSNIYDADSNRQSNLEFNLSEGVTIEFWLKKPAFDVGNNTEKEVIFDLWNGENSSSADYGRLRVELTGASTGSPFLVTAMSGTSGFYQQSIGTSLTTSSLEDWGHYAFTFLSGASNIPTSLYVNGDLNQKTELGSTSINEVTGALRAYIGALIESPSGSSGVPAGAGKLSASLDEYRYWKTKRTSEEIGRNWFTNIYGGTNTDKQKYSDRHPVDLGVYFKFNEGITGVTATDSVVLDYSGRVSNGNWTGYNTNSRNVGSAIVSASAASKEFKDPIIYSFHPDVVSFLNDKKEEGAAYDVQNNAALYNMLPRWVIDEDVDEGGEIKNLTQIMASYFDTLHLQIHSLSTLREATYSTYASASVSSSAKPLPFADKLLEGLGLKAPELFVDSEIIEKLTSRDEKRNFEEELHDIKNLIYHNIYNNLAYIYKSKGTEKSFRNLIRCFGIDDELVRFNIYGENALYKLRDNYRSTVVNKNVINFDDPDRFSANIYQYPSGSEIGYLTGSTALMDFPCTFEAEIIFPRKRKPGENGYFNTSFFSSSLFGLHEAGTTGTDTTWASGDDANFQVFSVRTSSLDQDLDTKDAYFVLTSSDPFPFPRLTSSVYPDVYDDTKWNFAVRLKQDKHEQNDMVLGTSGSDRTYSVEFYGVNTILDEVINEFTVSSSVTTSLAENFIQANKRVYMGAHRTNFTGSVLQQTDIKASSFRFWYDYIDNASIRAHSKDSTNLGVTHPYRNLSLFNTGVNNVYIPARESLALSWDFETVTGSAAGGTDGTGDFLIEDFSSASAEQVNRYGEYSTVTKRLHPGRGDFFPINSTASVENNYYHIAKQQLPELIFSDNMVNVVDEDDATFTRESRPTQFFFSVEKSMYQTISEEMVNMFATIVDFNNLIGETVHRYRHDYKELGKLRQLFFENVENTPDLDKYIDFYKWIDISITLILQQLSPASANVSEELRNMVENHILERSKYRNKFPLIKKRSSSENLQVIPGSPLDRIPAVPAKVGPEYGPWKDSAEAVAVRGDWEHNHSPLPGSPVPQNVNSSWWRNRAERSHPTITSGDANVDRDRDKILSASSPFIDSFGRRGHVNSAGFLINESIKSGVNFSKSKKIRYAHQATTEFGPTTVFTVGPFGLTASNNFVLFTKDDVEEFLDTTDTIGPPELEKKKWRFTAFNNSEIITPDAYDYNILKGDIAVPFNLYKHQNVIDGGYHDTINTNFKEGVDFTNLHVDVYGPDNETPLQGPFAKKHVGGLQYRHVDINRYDATKGTSTSLDDDTNRPEGWFLLMGSLASGEEAVGIVGPTYTTTDEYDKDTPRARLYRGLTAKSPVNIANIQTRNLSLGNYTSSIEYVQTVGRTENNAYFKENEGVSLPPRYATVLPKTTNVHTLIAATVDDPSEDATGNYFGVIIDGGESLTSLRFIEQDEDEANIFTLPRRDLTGSNSVIVSRFSAPGGPEISSRGYLDIIAEEYSVHNSLPFRNLSVRSSGSGEVGTIRSNILPGAGRDGLRTLLTRHQGQFGIDSQFGSVQVADYDTVGSFHKVPRNILRRIEISDETTTTATASVYNNFWVQNPIPRSDLQYSWFTASFLSYVAGAEVYGHAPADGFVSSSAQGVVPAYNFVSASEVSNTNGVVVPFAAHNTYLVDGVVSDQNLLSASNFPNGYVSGLGGVTNIPEAIHGITLLRHGPYQYPSWKQIRTGELQVARYQKRNNITSITTEAPKIFEASTTQIKVPARRGGVLRQFTEAPLTSKHKPLFHVLKVEQLTDPFDASSTTGEGKMVNSILRYTYANNKGMFSNSELNFLLGLKNVSRGTYDDISELYLDPSDDRLNNKFNFLLYRETVYPKSENAFLKNTRSRTTFIHPEWKSSREDRKEADATNSMGKTVASQSIWPLDARNDFVTATVNTPGTGSGTGELQNLYTVFHDGHNLGAAVVSTNSVRFTRNSYLTASDGGGDGDHSGTTLFRTYASSSTISFWVSTTRTRLSQSVIARGGGPGNTQTYEVRLHDGSIYGNVGHTYFSTDELKVTPTGWAAGTGWSHIAMTWDASTVRMYVNGVSQSAEQGGSVGSGTGSLDGDGANNIVVIGAVNNGSSVPNLIHTADGDPATEKHFKGYLDELTFFSGAASQADITTIYNSGNPVDVINTSFSSVAVLSHYRMGEDSSDGPLGTNSGFIQDVTAGGVSALTGNLSASATSGNGFGATNFGIKSNHPSNPNAGGNENIYGPLYNRPIPDRDAKGTESGIFVGDVLWEAAEQAGKEPFYNSYDDYREDFRGAGKDYSIIPEFRISEHMDYYINTQGNNFLADNPNFLELTGAATNKTSSAETDFFKTYTNTDFMSLFDVVKQDHLDANYDPTKLTLKCDGIIKLAPYKGFYPAGRTLQISTLFSQSFGENLAHKTEATTVSYGNQVNFRTFITPVLAPGVLYNSIKSGIAVDYPIMTASFDVAQPSFDPDGEISSSFRISSSFDYRLPFEVLIEPENHLGGVNIVDAEPHPSASINSTASWDGSGSPLFELAMSNFISEVPRFFLSTEGVTSLVSAKDNNKKYFKAKEGIEYKMRIVLRNGRVSKRAQFNLTPRDGSGDQELDITGSFFTKPTITMYSRRSAFGPPVNASFIDHGESFEPFTPPYMDGYSDVEFTFRPSETRFYFIDEIVSQLSSSYFRIGEQYYTSGSGASTAAFTNQMQISSSMNLLDIAVTKKATFDPVTGEAVLVEDDSTAPSVAIIQTKWECPILDFANVSVTSPTFGSGSAITRGMWHQYGVEPAVDKGVYVEVQDLTEEEITDSTLTGSLADLMGFSKSPIKLGQVLDEKIIREAVVAIPFVENKEGKKEFFDVSRREINEALAALREGPKETKVGQSIIEMVEKMQRYIFPPKFDFITNQTVDPVAMYIFEFEHTLKKQDLIDIWQNLPPEVGNKFEMKSSIVSHQLESNEIMKGELRDNLRWMVFKVKQKAADNYFTMLRDSVQEEGFQFEIQRGFGREKSKFNYSYNWPYDFFSLVELVKMDAEVKIENKTDKE